MRKSRCCSALLFAFPCAGAAHAGIISQSTPVNWAGDPAAAGPLASFSPFDDQEGARVLKQIVFSFVGEATGRVTVTNRTSFVLNLVHATATPSFGLTLTRRSSAVSSIVLLNRSTVPLGEAHLQNITVSSRNPLTDEPGLRAVEGVPLPVSIQQSFFAATDPVISSSFDEFRRAQSLNVFLEPTLRAVTWRTDIIFLRNDLAITYDVNALEGVAHLDYVFATIPTPASLALFTAAGCLASRKRRARTT